MRIYLQDASFQPPMKQRLTVADANKVEDCLLFLRIKRLIGDPDVERIRNRVRIALGWQNVNVRNQKRRAAP